MSTLTTQTPASIAEPRPDQSGSSRLPLNYSTLGDEPQWFGLPVSAWVKIGVIGLLMLALYWANLARLWLKTNPFTGQGNWEHAIVIPLIGIYYLYVWRDQLMGHVKPDPDAGRWTLPGIWALLMGVPLLLALAANPVLLSGGGGFSPATILAGFADGGVAKLLPVLGVLIALCGAAAAYVYVIRQELKYPATQIRLNNMWHGLGAWLMAMSLAWGIFFFVLVLVPGSFAGVVRAIGITITVVGLAGLGHIGYWGNSKLWRQRYDAILANSSVWFGTFVMLWGILFSFWGIYPGQNDFFKDIGMVVALFGIVTLVSGWRVMSVAWFPVVFLFCAIPWPDQVYSWVAMPLQNFAAKIGVFALNITGVEADKFGTKILFNDKNGKPEMLNVAEACAGLKSLMTFISVGAAVAFLSTRMLWQKLLIVASAVPIAILCNAFRVAGQGLLHRYVGPEWSQNFAHAFAGLVMLIPGFFLILLVCWVMDHLFVEEAEDAAQLKRGRKPALATASAAPSPAVAQVAAAVSSISADARPASTASTVPATAQPQSTPSTAAKPAPAAAKRVITIPKKPVSTKPAISAPPAASATGASPAAQTQAVAPATAPGVAPTGRPPQSRTATAGPAKTVAAAKPASATPVPTKSAAPAKPLAPKPEDRP